MGGGGGGDQVLYLIQPEKLLINWVFATLGILYIVPQLEKNTIMTNLYKEVLKYMHDHLFMKLL